jgi:hypothetical protein
VLSQSDQYYIVDGYRGEGGGGFHEEERLADLERVFPLVSHALFCLCLSLFAPSALPRDLTRVRWIGAAMGIGALSFDHRELGYDELFAMMTGNAQYAG